jgi:hypothetical protein
MKTDHILYATIGGSVVGLAWAASHLSVRLSFEQVVGYGAVIAMLALAAMDYGIKLFR